MAQVHQRRASPDAGKESMAITAIMVRPGRPRGQNIGWVVNPRLLTWPKSGVTTAGADCCSDRSAIRPIEARLNALGPGRCAGQAGVRGRNGPAPASCRTTPLPLPAPQMLI